MQNRSEIHSTLAQITRSLPDGSIAGPPFCVFHFITSVTSGHDVTLGIPVHGSYDDDRCEFAIHLPEDL